MKLRLYYDRYVPDMIIVGITYSGPTANYDSLRAVDYTPVASAANAHSGGAPKFLEFMRRELTPFIESQYPVDPEQRALMGNSLGGLFALYAMFVAVGSDEALTSPVHEFIGSCAVAGIRISCWKRARLQRSGTPATSRKG